MNYSLLNFEAYINGYRCRNVSMHAYSVVDNEEQEKKRNREYLDRLPSLSFVVILFIFEIDTKANSQIHHSHRMGDDRNQLVPSSSGNVILPLFAFSRKQFLFFIRICPKQILYLLFNRRFIAIIVKIDLFAKNLSFNFQNSSL